MPLLRRQNRPWARFATQAHLTSSRRHRLRCHWHTSLHSPTRLPPPPEQLPPLDTSYPKICQRHRSIERSRARSAECSSCVRAAATSEEAAIERECSATASRRGNPSAERRQAECGSCCIQGGRQATTNRSAVRDFAVGRTERVGNWWIEGQEVISKRCTARLHRFIFLPSIN